MAKIKTTNQSYPRIEDDSRKDDGCLDDSLLVPHQLKIDEEQLARIIKAAIVNADKKSRRAALQIPAAATEAELQKFYAHEGRELFKYFKKYVGDPAATAHQMYRKGYRQVGLELFRNRAAQKGRMNSGWRYQFLNSALAENQASDNARGYSRKEIELAILGELHSLHEDQSELTAISNASCEVLDAFGECCREADLLDEAGQFNEPRKLLGYLIAV